MKPKFKTCSRCNGSGTEIDRASIGPTMRGIRLAKKRSLRGVAFLMRISAAYLSDLEKGKRNWSNEIIARFKDACS